MRTVFSEDGVFRQQSLSKVVDEITYVITSDGGELLELNETATILWNRLHQWQSLPQLIRALQKEYDVNEKTARKDITAILKTLLKKKVIETKKS